MRDKENRKLYFCQDVYVDKILDYYNIIDYKIVNIPIASGIITLMVLYDKTTSKQDIEEYSSIVGSKNYLAC
jgi:hypothetical protein